MRIALVILIILLFHDVTQSKNTVLYGKGANEVVRGSLEVRFKEFSSIPNYVKFKKGEELPFDKLSSFLSNFYKLDYNYGLELINIENDNLGFTHYRYRQTINNIPVRLSMFIVHTKKGLIKSMNGELFDNAVGSNSIAITEQEAISFALSFINAETYKWEVELEEKHLKWSTENNDATYYPQADLVFISKDGKITNELRVAYKFNIYAHQPISRQEVYVDAITGEILFAENKIQHVDEVGTAQTAYSGLQVITSDSLGSNSYRLQEIGRGNGIRTFNCNNDTVFNNIDFINSNANWNLTGIDSYVLDAHWGAEMTYDYYLNKHGRNSIDGNGFRLDSYTHYANNYQNAFWDGTRMVYGDGLLSNNTSPFTSIDIVGHEITHGMTNFTADLIYFAESGALNESFSDIFGVTIDYVSRPSVANWLIGEEVNGVGIRNMTNPNQFDNPDTYLGDFWHPIGWGGWDNDGVHTNSGVQNFWYVLLVNGGNGINDIGNTYFVNGLGLDKAAEIAYRNLSVYLTPSSNYQDARFFSIQAAVDLYGECSVEVESVTNAWYAVGVGDAYMTGAYSDFEACYINSCEVPYTVDFSNNSQNGVSYLWDFGDGDTSSVYSPSHTYNNYGVYSVKLKVDGGNNCGTDSLIKTNYINIDSMALCNTSTPAQFGFLNITDCKGRLFDNGGACSNYLGASEFQILIQPPGSQQVSLDFIMFDVEAGSQGGLICDYDFLKIYDGPSTSSPLIGIFCNNNLPPSTINSTGNALTLVFISDNAIQNKGFEIEWSCIESTLAPVADFVSDVDSTCWGMVRFTDLSANGASNWIWDFGDGAASSIQHPIHYYQTSGIYTVKLTATNSFGTSTETKTDYIYVNIPVVPTVMGDTICSDTTAYLSAIGQGTLRWYDHPSNSFPLLATGNNFTTPILNTSKTYYVSDVLDGPVQSLGKIDNTGSGNYSNSGGLFFRVYKTIIIQSVKIYAQTAGNLNIIIADSTFSLQLRSSTNYVNIGEQIVELNFKLEPGAYYLNITNPTIPLGPKLYQNTGSISYPYTLNGLASIIRGNNPSGYYNFFYDWKVYEPGCSSPRVPVVAVVNSCVGIDELNLSSHILSYFNNSNNKIEVKFNNIRKGEYHLMVVSSLGQVVYNEMLNINGEVKNHNISMEGKSKGIYFLLLKNINGSYVNKILKTN